MRNQRKRSGFTLVEILIVVIILGILAAIVIPKFTNASSEAKRNTLAATLHSLRGQVELYMLQHGDKPPVLTGTDWTPLTDQTTFGTQTTGPYIMTAPANSVNGHAAILAVTSVPPPLPAMMNGRLARACLLPSSRPEPHIMMQLSRRVP